MKIIMLLLWAIFIAVTFFSCYDATVDDDLDYKVVDNTLSFVNCYLKNHSNQWINTTIIGELITINECMVGDTIGLTCYVDFSYRRDIPPPESVTARITTSKGDVEFIEFLDRPGVAYIAIVPHPPHQYVAYLPNEDMYPNLPEPFLISHIPIRYESKPEVRNGILSVSPDGDVIIAEIIEGCQHQKTKLNVRSK
jgi:hypothetical protein